jgi:hypothetical protein
MTIFLKVPEAGSDCVAYGNALLNGIGFPKCNPFNLFNASDNTLPGCPQIHRVSSCGFLKRLLAIKLQYLAALNTMRWGFAPVSHVHNFCFDDS